VIVRGHVDAECTASPNASSSVNGPSPLCRFVNIELLNATDKESQATVLLENPRGKYVISPKELLNQVIGFNNYSMIMLWFTERL